MISILLLGAFVATSFTFGKAALEYTTPLFLVGARFFISGIFLSLYYRFRHKKLPTINKKEATLLVQIIFFGFYVGPCFLYWALQYLSSGKAALFYGASPFVAAFFSYLIFHEKMTWKKILGLSIGLIGFVPAVIMNSKDDIGSSILSISLPELGVLAGVGGFAYGWVLMRKLFRESKIPSTFVSAVGMIIGGLGAIITSFFTEWYLQSPVSDYYNFGMLLAGLVFFSTIISYILYIYNLKKYTATLMTFGEMLTPLFAAVYGWIFLGETVGVYFFASVVFFLVGMYIFYQAEKDLGYFMEV